MDLSRSQKPNLILIASPRARIGTGSPLLRLARDYSATLKKYLIHTTRATGQDIYSTGLFSDADIELRRAGSDGGLAELAAQVARGNVVAAILLLDPADPWIDAVETRTLRRVCIQLRTRLISTYAAAIRWLTFEAEDLEKILTSRQSVSAALQFPRGTKNVSAAGELISLEIVDRTIALIAHDKKKLEMVDFVCANTLALSKHQRILTTGTTGTLLKLLFSSPKNQELLLQGLAGGLEERLCTIALDILNEMEIRPKKIDLQFLLGRLRDARGIRACPAFAEKIVVLPSGPAGGDVLIAEAVLQNECHSIVFLHDPLTAHPHSADIRLLEHTSQLPGVFAECVSDRVSAEQWINGLLKEETQSPLLRNLASELRERFSRDGLRDAVVVPHASDRDGHTLGAAIARAAAGYFHHKLLTLLRQRDKLTVGIAWGWGTRAVLEWLISLDDKGRIARPKLSPETITWSPLIGTIAAELTDREASAIAEGFADFYGGQVEAFPCGGFTLRDARIPAAAARLERSLEEADLILTAAAPWSPTTALIQETGLSDKYFPAFDSAVGLVSGVFLNLDAKEVEHRYRIVGLGYEGFRKAAARDAVILMCGGERRKLVLQAALRAKMVSTLITTASTADWLLTGKRSANRTFHSARRPRKLAREISSSRTEKSNQQR